MTPDDRSDTLIVVLVTVLAAFLIGAGILGLIPWRRRKWSP